VKENNAEAFFFAMKWSLTKVIIIMDSLT
jgi:hypothetical protein